MMGQCGQGEGGGDEVSLHCQIGCRLSSALRLPLGDKFKEHCRESRQACPAPVHVAVFA